MWEKCFSGTSWGRAGERGETEREKWKWYCLRASWDATQFHSFTNEWHSIWMQPLWQPPCITTYQRWYSQSDSILVQHYVKHQLRLNASSTQHTHSGFVKRRRSPFHRINTKASPWTDSSLTFSSLYEMSPKSWAETWNPRYGLVFISKHIRNRSAIVLVSTAQVNGEDIISECWLAEAYLDVKYTFLSIWSNHLP